MKYKFLAVTAAVLLAGTAIVHAADTPQAINPEVPAAAADRPDKGPRFKRPSPEMMEQKLADRLKLTDEQRKLIKERRLADREQLKPLFDQMKDIRTKIDEIRRSNMEAFEAILTSDQKAKFDKIKAERKAHHMERKKMHMKPHEMRRPAPDRRPDTAASDMPDRPPFDNGMMPPPPPAPEDEIIRDVAPNTDIDRPAPVPASE